MLESKYKVDLNPLIHINILHVGQERWRPYTVWWNQSCKFTVIRIEKWQHN